MGFSLKNKEYIRIFIISKFVFRLNIDRTIQYSKHILLTKKNHEKNLKFVMQDSEPKDRPFSKKRLSLSLHIFFLNNEKIDSLCLMRVAELDCC